MDHHSREYMILFAIGMLTATFGYIVYYLLLRIIGTYSKTGYFGVLNNYRFILIRRGLGFLIFGIIPLFFTVILGLWDSELWARPVLSGQSLLWIVIFSVAIIYVNYFIGNKSHNLSTYPEIRIREWSFYMLLLSTLSWFAYLLAYEFLFRGLLLFPSVELMGFWPAIILNTLVYSIAHIPKGRKETLAAIPMGLVLCYFAVLTGSFWVAFYMHLLLALTNEWFSLKFHPEMKMIWIK